MRATIEPLFVLAQPSARTVSLVAAACLAALTFGARPAHADSYETLASVDLVSAIVSEVVQEATGQRSVEVSVRAHIDTAVAASAVRQRAVNTARHDDPPAESPRPRAVPESRVAALPVSSRSKAGAERPREASRKRSTPTHRPIGGHDDAPPDLRPVALSAQPGSGGSPLVVFGMLAGAFALAAPWLGRRVSLAVANWWPGSAFSPIEPPG